MKFLNENKDGLTLTASTLLAVVVTAIISLYVIFQSPDAVNAWNNLPVANKWSLVLLLALSLVGFIFLFSGLRDRIGRKMIEAMPGNNRFSKTFELKVLLVALGAITGILVSVFSQH